VSPNKRLPLVFCRIGVHTIAFESHLVKSSEALGAFVPSHDLAETLGLTMESPIEAPQASQCLHFHPETRIPPCRVEGMVELREIPYTDIHPLPPLLAARCRILGVQAIIREGQSGPCVLICRPPF
jgi:hypothetical protein